MRAILERAAIVAALGAAIAETSCSGDYGEASAASDGGARDADATTSDGGEPSEAAPADVADARSDRGASACDPTAPFGAASPVAGVNTPSTDGALRLFPDELGGVLSANRSGTTDLWLVARPTLADPFAVGRKLVAVSADGVADGSPTVTTDQRLLVFHSTRSGVFALYAAERPSATEEFGAPQRLFGDTRGTIVDPWIVPGSDALYLALAPDGSPRQIYRSTRQGSSYAAPVQVAFTTPSALDYEAPVVSADELVLYFASAAPGGKPVDIFVATRKATDQPFGRPVLVSELNSVESDHPTWISPDLCRLYLASDRGGNMDLYVATRTPR